MMNPSCTRSAPIGVEYCLPDFLPVCRIVAAYEFFRPASAPMTGLSKYLFEIRTARSSGRARFPVQAPRRRRYSGADCGCKTAISGWRRSVPPAIECLLLRLGGHHLEGPGVSARSDRNWNGDVKARTGGVAMVSNHHPPERTRYDFLGAGRRWDGRLQ